MTERPRLAVIVSNAITGDSRVQKTALSAAHDGWDVLLIGRSTSQRAEHTWLGPVQVVRVPVGRAMRKRERLRRRRTVRARVTQLGLPNRDAQVAVQKAHEANSRRRGEQIGRFVGPGAPAVGPAPALALRVWRRLTAEGHTFRMRAFWWEERHRQTEAQVTGNWRRDWPALLDLDLAFGPVIEAFGPDLIHANDVTMLNTAATTVGRMRAAGKTVSWLYDAHEYVAGVEWPYPRMMSAYPAVERALIDRADAVATVSPEIAEIIQQENKLPELPLVVRNTPVRAAIGASTASVRQVVGLAPDVPLLVYSGYIHHERGIGTAVEALPELSGVHLAIVSGQSNPELRAIVARADELGVSDRVHVAPYVAQQEVVDYLRSADLGVICSKKTINYELSLPTKLSEYLHAGLPVVVSDVKTLSAFVREHGVGAVFASGEPASFRDAVQQALSARDALAAAIAEPVLDELSWEHQSANLLDLYRSLSGKNPVPRIDEATWDVQERPRSAAKFTAADANPWRPLGATRIRLGMGPANFAGQLGSIAQAITAARPDVSAEVFVRFAGSPFQYPADVITPGAKLERLEGQIQQLDQILPRYTHLLADAFRPVFGTLNGTDISGDLPALARYGIKVGLLSHGSDSRHPLEHRDRSPYSLFHDAPDETIAKLLANAIRNRRIAAESGLPVFVTTPDLIDDLPGATWLPLIVDLERWACDEPVMQRDRPIVVHAPSKRWTKGTDRFANELNELDRRGLIEFQLIENLPWAEMRARIQAADIVLDQFAIGSYGTLACEAMAAGKPVLAWLSDTVLAATGPVPILNTPPDQVVATVQQLLDDRDLAAKSGAESLEYVRRLHDGRESIRRLTDFLRP